MKQRDLLTNAILRIDSGRHVLVNGRSLKLGPKERALIVVLAEHTIGADPGAYLATEAVLRAIEMHNPRLKEFNLAWVPDAGDVYSAFSKIRKKLRAERLDHALIERVHGKGYRLSLPAVNIIIEEPRPSSAAWHSRNSPADRESRRLRPHLMDD